MNESESKIQSEIRIALSQRGCIVIRQSSGKFLSMDGRRIVTVGIPGISDLQVILPNGNSAWVETKRAAGGVRSQEQINFIEQMRIRGCRAGFAKSVEEAFEICGLK